MQRFLIGVLLLISPFISKGQGQPLAQSRHSSYYTYILKLNKHQAENFNFWDYLTPKNFISVVDSFPTDSVYHKTLPEGNYMYVKATEQEVTAEMHLNHNFRVELIPIHSEFALSVLDSNGKPIPNAIVKVGKRIIPYNASKMWYSSTRFRIAGKLEVSVGDCVEFNTISQGTPNSSMLHILRLVKYYTYDQVLWLPRKLIYNTRYRRRSSYSYYSHSDYYFYDKKDSRITFKYAMKAGYVDFSKPKYLPNDTVKCKIYIANNHGKPYTQPLNFYLFRKWGSGQPILTREVKPTVPGSYTLEFPLGDTILLDEEYNVVLGKRKRKKIEIFKEGTFKYEDYQLSKTAYKATLDKNDFGPGDSIIIHASGKDANGLPILDGKIKVSVILDRLRTFYKDSIFMNDTLWTTTHALKDEGETKLVIPDSVIPKANADYNVNVTFNNSNFEKHDTTIKFTIDEFAEVLKLTTAKTFIIATHTGASPPGDKYYLEGIDKDEKTVFRHKVNFPYSEPLNPLVENYELYSAHRDTKLKITNDSSGFSSWGNRTKDSAFFFIYNTNNLPFHYTIYKNHKEFLSGNLTSSFTWKQADNSMTDYLMVCTYLWGGDPKQVTAYALIADKSLDIEINQPATVSPGDKADVTISVKDFNGKPVPNMNITAACVNAEFKEKSEPNMPYFGKSKGYVPYHNYYSNGYYVPTQTASAYLSPWWISRFKLDTISYYKAIYPKDGFYIQYDPIGKAEAQFAPYVFNYKEKAQSAISMIYIDSDFVYYYNTDKSQPYAFIGTSGYHNIRIRLANKSMIVERVLFRKNYKLQICIEDTTTNKALITYRQRRYLDPYETADVQSSIFHLANTLGNSNYYIWENKKVRILHSPGYDYDRYSTIDLGPFRAGGGIHFARENLFNYFLPFEGGYSYEANPNQYVIMRQLYERQPDSLPQTERLQPRFGDTAYSLASVELNSKPISILPFVYSPPFATREDYGTFTYLYPGDSTLFAIAMERDKSDTLNHWLFLGSKKIFYDLPPGTYYFQFITKYNYSFETMVTIHANSTFCRLFSKPKWSKLDTNSVPYRAIFKKEKLKTVNEGYSFGPGKIKVRIIDSKTLQPLPFANVEAVYQGSQMEGTTTDIDGYAELTNLNVVDYTIKVVYIGYMDGVFYNLPATGNADKPIDLKLTANLDALKEVMVMSYRQPLITAMDVSKSVTDSSDIHSMAASDINSIAASVPGVYSVVHYHHNVRYLGDDLTIKGSRTDATQYIIDGQKVTADQGIGQILEDEPNVKSRDITKGTDLAKDSITKKDISAKSQRNRYSDYAYWEPDLMTDENGVAKFTATFPDNITGWKAHAEGMDSKKRTGEGQACTRSFRKISAQLELPRFLIAGDQSKAIGKAFNYTSVPYSIKRIFTVDGKEPVIKDTLLNKAVITSYPVTAGNTDSLRANFQIELENGYKDGEQRSIPIFPIGVKEKTGTFLALNRDTNFSLSFDTSKGTVFVHMDSDPFDFLQRDVDYLRYYPYECNEQISSKILGLIAEKNIYKVNGKKFKDDNLLQRLITKLIANQNKDGSWGWWQGGKANPWMTAYVLHALSAAQTAGYNAVEFVKNDGYNYLRWSLKLLDKNILLFGLKTLSQAGEVADYDSLMKHIKVDSLTIEQLANYEIIARKQGIPYDYEKVLKRKKQTLMGNIYWEGYQDGWYNNSMTSTIAAFELFSTDSTKTDLCESIFNYLLEERKYGGYWMNTIQTASIVDILTPYLISHHKMNSTPPSVSLKSTSVNQDIKTFPYSARLNDNSMRVNKTGSYPVYFTAYQNVFNSNPQPIETRFEIKTVFKCNNRKTDTLTPGEQLTLLVEVDVKQKGDYLMLSVPIPAGCSYGENENNHSYEEVHREQYKDHTNIYIEQLSPGHYEFSINLQARYGGVYTLNPAQLESMYFPTLNGRNAIRKISIK